MIYFIIAFIILALIAFALYRIYCFALGFPPKLRPDSHNIPRSPGYMPHIERMEAVIKDTEQTPHEEITILSEDGLRLYGRLYTFKEGAPLMIAFHGYHGIAAWDGFGYYQVCKRNGINILLVDQRSHGKSEGNFLTFGVKERQDCKKWAEYMSERLREKSRISQKAGDDKLPVNPETGKRGTDDLPPIYLAGVSMGAATVLLASALDLPKNVKAVIEDCGYTDAPSMVKIGAKGLKLPVGLVYGLLDCATVLFAGMRLKQADVVTAVESTDIPILFIHGAEDPLVPIAMSETLYEHCKSRKKRVVIEGALHANSAMTDFETYEREILEFLKGNN